MQADEFSDYRVSCGIVLSCLPAIWDIEAARAEAFTVGICPLAVEFGIEEDRILLESLKVETLCQILQQLACRGNVSALFLRVINSLLKSEDVAQIVNSFSECEKVDGGAAWMLLFGRIDIMPVRAVQISVCASVLIGERPIDLSACLFAKSSEEPTVCEAHHGRLCEDHGVVGIVGP